MTRQHHEARMWAGRISIEIVATPPDSELNEVLLFVENQKTDYVVEDGAEGACRLTASIPLKASDYTVLTLETPMFRPAEIGINDSRKLGIKVADISIEPIFPVGGTLGHLEGMRNEAGRQRTRQHGRGAK